VTASPQLPQPVESGAPAAAPSAREWLGFALLIVATLLAYHPAWHAGFIWDDDAHVTRPFLQSLGGLARIWGEPGATPQYYPLLYSAFWLEHRAWGDHAAAYHLLNILLHAGVACLLFRCLRVLAVPGAFLAAALFALHPVCVESVAWISEQKNTLSALLYLAAALAYLRFDRDRRPASYALGLGLFLLALLTKSVTATLPAALLVVLWWRRGRLRARGDVLPLAPWLALGIASGFFTAWMERTHVGARGPAFALGPADRLLVAGHALWFYLGKLAWPANLTFIYPRWVIRAADPLAWAFPLAVLAALAVLWRLRRRTRGPLAAALLFCGTLVPALGFVDLFPFLYSFVADHFQYLAAPAVLAGAAAGLTVLAARLSAGGRLAVQAGAFTAVAFLGVLTWHQCGMYANLETLWRTTIARNPSCWMAYNNLASELLKDGRQAEAIADLGSALALAPGDASAHATLGRALAQTGRFREAAGEYERALELEPANAAAHENYGILLAATGHGDEAAAHFRSALAAEPESAGAHTGLGNVLLQEGQLGEAGEQYRLALGDDPTDVAARTNLGAVLVQWGDAGGARAEFEQALALNPRFAPAQLNLANVLLQTGHADQAIPHLEATLAADPRSAVAEGDLGYALLQVGRTREAVTHLERALQLDPRNADAASNLQVARAQARGGASP
jgi:Flp pilus assembly protein TadD